MRHVSRHLFAGGLFCCLAASAWAQTLPGALRPPEGATLIGRYPARGVQIYTCVGKTGAMAWTLKAPDAELSGADGKPFARHFAGPTWTARDGSSVTGKLLNEQSAPRPDSVDWLLLSATSTGNGTLAGTKFVQRVATKGGEAPGGACGTPGQEIRVPYSADYVFYR